MSKQVLHILNGDATRHLFERSSLTGDVVVWREVLCEGPVKKSIREESFWKERANFIDQNYPGGGSYAKMVQPQMNRLSDLSDVEEVVLWFEYDLFCHVNMVACLSLIEHENISLVCLGDEIDGQLRGLGEIAPKQYPILFENRLALQQVDIEFAHAVWHAYAGDDEKVLQEVIQKPSSFKYMGPAMESHFEKFPRANGLNGIEQTMLEFMQAKSSTDRQIVGAMLRNQTWLGFGDLQYFQMLDELQSLYDAKFQLNDWGSDILNQKSIYSQPDTYIGGVSRQAYFKRTFDR